MARSKENKDTIVNVLTHACDDKKNDPTRNTYKRSAREFAYYIREEHGINYPHKLPDRAGCVDLIKEYADFLKERGLAGSSIHTYVAGVCHAVGRVMSDHISEGEVNNRPSRKGRPTQGRDPDRNRQGRMEAAKDENRRLVDFAGAVGIRRSEYARLDGRCYRPDESGYMCVWVRGKGGKLQAQRILPWNEPIVSNTLAGVRGKEKVFSGDDMDNKINLHGIRRQVARRAYDYYCSRLREDPSYREQLRKELIDRYDTMHPHGYKNDETTRERYIKEIRGYGGVYTCRGENAEALRKQGRDTSFNRLALMAVSVFHLSHWRSDVTVKNYMV